MFELLTKAFFIWSFSNLHILVASYVWSESKIVYIYNTIFIFEKFFPIPEYIDFETETFYTTNFYKLAESRTA